MHLALSPALSPPWDYCGNKALFSPSSLIIPNHSCAASYSTPSSATHTPSRFKRIVDLAFHRALLRWFRQHKKNAWRRTNMVLEATVIILDNSEWMRNGDFHPTRFLSQFDAVNYFLNVKLRSNPENSVALISMAGKCPETGVTLTTDLSKLELAMHNVKTHGSPNFSRSIQIAQLVLKHRQNKIQKQRIIAFVGSPVHESAEELSDLGKKIKKNGVSVDVITFGESQSNHEKLFSFNEAVNNSGGSVFLNVEATGVSLKEAIVNSRLFSASGGEASFAGASEGNNEFGFDVDPSMDPELALALRLSLDEERARQAASNNQGGSTEAPAEFGEMDIDQNQGSSDEHEFEEIDEEEQLMRAIQMSLAGGNQNESSNSENENSGSGGGGDAPNSGAGPQGS